MVSGDGDPRVFVLEQVEPGRFATLTLDGDVGQAGGQLIHDLNGDGQAELLVSSYDNNLVSLYVRDSAGAHPVGVTQPRTPIGLENLPPSSTPTPGPTSPDSGATSGTVEEAPPTDLMVRVSYEGPESGELVVAAFPSLPATGPPAKFVSMEVTSFPVEVTLEGLTLPACQILTFLDLEPFGLTFPSATDPIAESTLIDLGETTTLELSLEKP